MAAQQLFHVHVPVTHAAVSSHLFCFLQLNFPVGQWHELEASPARWTLPIFLFSMLFPLPMELWQRLAITGEMNAELALQKKGAQCCVLRFSRFWWAANL